MNVSKQHSVPLKLTQCYTSNLSNELKKRYKEPTGSKVSTLQRSKTLILDDNKVHILTLYHLGQLPREPPKTALSKTLKTSKGYTRIFQTILHTHEYDNLGEKDQFLKKQTLMNPI